MMKNKATVKAFSMADEYQLKVQYELTPAYEGADVVWVHSVDDALVWNIDTDRVVYQSPETEHDIVLQEMGYEIVVPAAVQDALIDQAVEDTIEWLLGDIENESWRKQVVEYAVANHESECFCSEIWDASYEDWLGQGQHLVILATFRSWDLFDSLKRNPLIDPDAEDCAWETLESRLGTYYWFLGASEGDPTACYVGFIHDGDASP
jgi:hypothetical protein